MGRVICIGASSNQLGLFFSRHNCNSGPSSTATLEHHSMLNGTSIATDNSGTATTNAIADQGGTPHNRRAWMAPTLPARDEMTRRRRLVALLDEALRIASGEADDESLTTLPPLCRNRFNQE